MRSCHISVALAFIAMSLPGSAQGPGIPPGTPVVSPVPALLGADSASVAQRPKTGEPIGPQPKANIRIDTNVVLVPVTVNDPLNRFVTGLDQEVFK